MGGQLGTAAAIVMSTPEAVRRLLAEFPALKQRLEDRGVVVFDPLRATAYERFFFREPINGYVFEVIDAAAQTPRASHLDQ